MKELTKSFMIGCVEGAVSTTIIMMLALPGAIVGSYLSDLVIDKIEKKFNG